MNESDLYRLVHMRRYAREVLEFTLGKVREDLDQTLLSRAVAYSTCVIGEAASHISLEFRQMHPEISWKSIVGMRNFLVHEYFYLDLDILWKTATEDIPKLVEELEKIVPSETDLSEIE